MRYKQHGLVSMTDNHRKYVCTSTHTYSFKTCTLSKIILKHRFLVTVFTQFNGRLVWNMTYERHFIADIFFGKYFKTKSKNYPTSSQKQFLKECQNIII